MSAEGAAPPSAVPALRASSARYSYPELTLGSIHCRRFAPQIVIQLALISDVLYNICLAHHIGTAGRSPVFPHCACGRPSGRRCNDRVCPQVIMLAALKVAVLKVAVLEVAALRVVAAVPILCDRVPADVLPPSPLQRSCRLPTRCSSGIRWA